MSDIPVPVDPLSAGLTLGGKILDFVGRWFPDKTKEEQNRFALELQQLANDHADNQSQLAINAAEAASPDRVNHWRGALGWVCDVAIAWNYILEPLLQYTHAVGVSHGWWSGLPAMPVLNDAPLMQLILLMLGSHAIPAIAGAIKK